MEYIQPSNDVTATAIAVAAQIVRVYSITTMDPNLKDKPASDKARAEAALVTELARRILDGVTGPSAR